jgi:hypothetical protein
MMSDRGTLQDVLTAARSKNAGPFSVAIDLFFPDEATLDAVLVADAVTPETVGRVYGIEPQSVQVFECRPALAIKVGIPRWIPGGSPGDSDIAGGQQFVPLLDLPL